MLCATIIFAAVSASYAHETDQFTLPAGRHVADLGLFVNKWIYNAIVRGVDQTNQRIQSALARHAGASELAELQSPLTIANAVNAALPNAYSIIEGYDWLARSSKMQQAHPGMVVGYKKEIANIYQHTSFPLDPRQFFRIWLAGTIKVDGVYLGTDKIGHFTDMGILYFRTYQDALRSGKTSAQATQAALDLGQYSPIYSEQSVLGYLTAGDYSNADLAANYLGFLFYLNLTQPVRLKGQLRPALLMRHGPVWQLAPFVSRGSNFFSWFISDHLDEALNPGLFEIDMRGPLREAVAARAVNILWRYEDSHGCRHSPQWFDAKALNLSTYYGVDYGHRGTLNQLVTIGNTCYRPPDMNNPKSRNARGQSPLDWAVLNGDLPMTRYLLDHGADVNATIQSDEAYSASWGSTALHLAARTGKLKIVELLIEHGAHVNVHNDRGVTPLHLAYRHRAIAALLISHGAKVNAMDAHGRTALSWAAADPYSKDVALLIAHNANTNIADHDGFTPLHLAAQSGSLASVNILLAHGADPNVIASLGLTPLHLAADRHNGGAIALALITGGARVDMADAFGWTPLDDAARHGDITATHVLLTHGAQINRGDNYGTTPLHLACRYEHATVAGLLMARGASVTARNDAGDTPLHAAAFAGDWRLVDDLLSHGASLTARNTAGLTAAAAAEQQGYGQLAVALTRSSIAPLRGRLARLNAGK